MKNLFTTPVLIIDAQGNSSLVERELSLHPGEPLAFEDGAVLAGGFPKLTPECTIPLSPTLQLNADCSDLSQPALTKLAEAELLRQQKREYRSYVVDSDPRLTVVARCADSLDAFLTTYGGLLSIEPILVEEFSSLAPTATELSVKSGRHAGVVVRYACRQPFTSSRCSYCGLCALHCPENCISPDLEIDYSRCTLCRKCEETCPHDALQVHGMEYRELKTPALLLLDDCQIEGAEQSRNIYRLENFESYLATLYAFQVDEIVSIDKNICQYNENLGKGCTLCSQACPHGAISLAATGVQIDPLSCEECGACVAVCPTGSLQYERFCDQTFVEYCQELLVESGAQIVIGESEDLRSFWWKNRDRRFSSTIFLSYEKLGFLSLFDLLFLFARGFSCIQLMSRAPSSTLLDQVKLANALLLALFPNAQAIVIVEQPEELIDSSERLPIVDFPQWQNRREALSTLLAQFLQASSARPGFKGAAQIPFAHISCDKERCTQCMSCINVCRIQAMKADEHGLILSHQGSLCVGCGLCVGVCPEQALTISRNWQLREEFFQAPLLAAGEPMLCEGCGKVFGSKKSYQRVMDILSKKESFDPSHFTYCEDCRVIRLFEEQE